MMKHLTKIFVSLAIILFVIGYYLQATGHENQGVKLLLVFAKLPLQKYI
ncbi:hypothetical protein HI031_04535 [Staphylococcus haemolyticus]|nr:hypothetical protein HI031_04535 [Staphylococcus haemolyticus]